MIYYVILGLMIPFLGTVGGALCVFFMKKTENVKSTSLLNGFAAGVMTAASVWSLIIPSMEMWQGDDLFRFIPAAVGFVAGVVFIPLIYGKFPICKDDMSAFAIVVHNIPEGMAVGVALAAMCQGNGSVASAIALAVGIGIQNIPEGAIISMPALAGGVTKRKAFAKGVCSGLVEPLGGILTLIASEIVTAFLPYFLSFAAGAMIYVVVTELVPESVKGDNEYSGVLSFTAGFLLMMILDVTL